jgi:cell fate regulator YaaT (PSP1 superfamily)
MTKNIEAPETADEETIPNTDTGNEDTGQSESVDSPSSKNEAEEVGEQFIYGVQLHNKRGIFTLLTDGELTVGDSAIVKTSRGKEFVKVTRTGLTEEIDRSKEVVIQRFIRKATADDFKAEEKNREKEKKALKTIIRKVELLKLEMKVVRVEYLFDNSRIIFYFVAPQKVDFRELVKILAGEFRTRIELRQINPREYVGMMGACGPCGRNCCCSSHMAKPPVIDISMVENQRLGKNPAKLNGVCGRLKCCLKYENDYYVQEFGDMPKRGCSVCDGQKRGLLTGSNVFHKTMTVRWEDGLYVQYPFDEFDKFDILGKDKQVEKIERELEKELTVDPPEEQGENEGNRRHRSNQRRKNQPYKGRDKNSDSKKESKRDNKKSDSKNDSKGENKKDFKKVKGSKPENQSKQKSGFKKDNQPVKDDNSKAPKAEDKQNKEDGPKKGKKPYNKKGKRRGFKNQNKDNSKKSTQPNNDQKS